MDVVELRTHTGPVRRLAAIMAADVAGYSRLIGDDEVGTLARMDERRGTMDALIAAHGGRIANTAGDSVLAEFASIIEAMACALAVQQDHATANAALPAERRVAYRIGVHIGDVVVRDGDLFGDGVNVAARLQALAAPGGITVSGKVHDEIKRRMVVAFRHAGVQTLKNVRDPIPVWHVGTPGSSLDAMPIALSRHWLAVRVVGIVAFAMLAAGAVGVGVMTWRGAGEALPTYRVDNFAAVGDMAAARPLADAVAAELAGGIGAIPYVRLVQPQSADGRATRARYVVTGAVTVTGSATHVDARIVEAADGKVLASSSFDAPPREPALMQEEILGAIGDDLSVAINQLRFPGPPMTAQTLRARELAREARDLTDRHEDPSRATAMFDEAARLSPADVDIAGWQANHLIALAVSYGPSAEQRQAYLDRARAIIDEHGDLSQLHRLLAYAKCQLANYSGHPDAAVDACGAMRLIAPWSARVYKEIGTAYLSLGLPEQALSAFEQAEQFNRRFVVRWTWEFKAGIAALLLGRDHESVAWLTEATTLRGGDPGLQALLAVAYRRAGNPDGVARQISVLRQFADRTALRRDVDDILKPYVFSDPTLQTRLSGLRSELVALAGA